MRRPALILTALALALTVLGGPAGSQGSLEEETARFFLRHPDTGDSCSSPRFLSRSPAIDDLECGWSRNTSTVIEGYSITEDLVLVGGATASGTLQLGTSSTYPGYGQYDLSVALRARGADGSFLTLGGDGPVEVQAVSVIAPEVIMEWSIQIPEQLDGVEISQLTFEFTQADSVQVYHGYVRKDEAESFVDLPVYTEQTTG